LSKLLYVILNFIIFRTIISTLISIVRIQMHTGLSLQYTWIY